MSSVDIANSYLPRCFRPEQTIPSHRMRWHRPFQPAAQTGEGVRSERTDQFIAYYRRNAAREFHQGVFEAAEQICALTEGSATRPRNSVGVAT